LSVFARKLRVYAILEDRFVYRPLLRHSDQSIVARAKEYQHHIHSLRDRMNHFATQWLSVDFDMMAPGPRNHFIEQTTSIFELISKRTALEDRNLYPLVEGITNASGPITSSVEPVESS